MSFVTEMSIQNKTKRTKEELAAAEDKRLKALEEDSKKVTGIFKNIEAPGGSLTFSFRKYKEDPYRTYDLDDGKSYTIPLGVAKHINNMTAVPVRDYATDVNGNKQLYTIIKSKRQRYQFLSTEFM